MTEASSSPTHYPPPGSAPVALVVAHPGHELRLHHWLELYRPHTFVLTDGSGSGDQGRIEASRRALERCGAVPGTIFGVWTDREAYRIVLDHRLEEVQRVVLDLAESLVRLKVELLASDAVEGFNSTHDLCFVIAEAALNIASRRLGRPIPHLDFPLEAAPGSRRITEGAPPLRLVLDASAFDRKLEAADAYLALQGEVERALEIHSSEAFRVEVLSPVPAGSDLDQRALGEDQVPFYERHGAQRVAEGTYRQVLRYRQHWLPLAWALRRWAAETA